MEGRGALGVRERWQMFDGRRAHATLPFDGRVRYTIIFWAHREHARLPQAEREAAESLGFVFPAPLGSGAGASAGAASSSTADTGRPTSGAPSPDAIRAFRAFCADEANDVRGGRSWAEGAIRREAAVAAPPGKPPKPPKPKPPPRPRNDTRRARDRWPSAFGTLRERLREMGMDGDVVEHQAEEALEAAGGDQDAAIGLFFSAGDEEEEARSCNREVTLV